MLYPKQLKKRPLFCAKYAHCFVLAIWHTNCRMLLPIRRDKKWGRYLISGSCALTAANLTNTDLESDSICGYFIQKNERQILSTIVRELIV